MSYIDLSGISLPENWYKLQISNDRKHTIYTNIQLGLCTISPVFTFADLDNVIGNILGWQYDTTLLQKQIDKLHKILSNNGQLQEDDPQVIKAKEQMDLANERANENLMIEPDLTSYDKQIYFKMIDQLDKYTEEVSLLNYVSQDLFQCQPDYDYIDQTFTVDNPKLKFYCSMKINNKEIGRGIASNKKNAKVLASKQAFKLLSPTLFKEWSIKRKNDQMEITEEEVKEIFNLQSNPPKIAQKDCLIPQLIPEQQQHGLASNSIHQMNNPETKPVESMFAATDAEIDDPELMTNKRHLTQRFTPLTIIKSLQDKHRTISIEEETSSYKHTLNNQPVFIAEFIMKSKGISGRDENMNKARARQIAAQRFLKNLFPPGYTWQKVVALVSSTREPLSTFMSLND